MEGRECLQSFRPDSVLCEQSTGPAQPALKSLRPSGSNMPSLSLSLSSPPPSWPSCWGSRRSLTSRIEPLPVTGSPTPPLGPSEQQWLHLVGSFLSFVPSVTSKGQATSS